MYSKSGLTVKAINTFSILSPVYTFPLPIDFTVLSSPHNSFTTVLKAVLSSFKLGVPVGFGPTTIAPALTNSLILLATFKVICWLFASKAKTL